MIVRASLFSELDESGDEHNFVGLELGEFIGVELAKSRFWINFDFFEIIKLYLKG